MAITVLLADDHPVFRKGLGFLLAEETDIQVVGEAGDGQAAIEMAKTVAPDVVVMDISMPNLDGIEATQGVLAVSPDTKVMALSIHGEKRFVEDMLRAGATGYMLKESAPEELVAGIRAVHQNEIYLSAAITDVVVNQYRTLLTESVDLESTHPVADSILVSKLFRPQLPPGTVPRPRVLAPLDGWRQRPLTLVSAPAGYGKSTAICQWLEMCDCPSIWLSLDPEDNDVRQFLTYIVAAIQTQFPDGLEKTTPLVKAPQMPSMRVVANTLINDLESNPTRFVLVLDDYHTIVEPEIHQLLSELLRYPSRSLHLVLVTRSDPALDLLRLRAYDQVSDLRAQALSFSIEEASTLLEQMTGEPVAENVVEALIDKTEGWVTGLRLLTLSMHTGIQLADASSILPGEQQTLDYLIAETLSRQPRDVQAWLLKTSILDRFCASLCTAVCVSLDHEDTRSVEATAGLDGGAFIRWLTEANLFSIALDHDGLWYRYHHLFQELLRNQLKNALPAEEIAALHVRASHWFAEHDLIGEALKHALAGNDAAFAVDLVVKRRYDLLNTEQWNRLDRWLNRLPSDIVNTNPTLLITQAWSAVMFHSQIAGWSNTPDQIEALLSASSMDEDEKTMVEAEANALRATLLYSAGELAGAIEVGEQALRNLHPESNSMRGQTALMLALAQQGIGDYDGAIKIIQSTIDHYAPSNYLLQTKMLMGLCSTNWLEGNITEMKQPALQLLSLGEKVKLSESVSFGRYFLGCFHYLRNELAEAQSYFRAVVENRYLARAFYHAQCVFGLALCEIALDQSDQAQQVVESLIEYTLETDNTWLYEVTQAFQAELALRLFHGVESEHLSKVSKPDFFAPMYVFYVPMLTAVRAKLAINTPESRHDAADLLNHLHDVVVSTHNTRVRIDVLALQALLHSAQGNETAALNALSGSLALASRGGFIRNYVDLGRPMALLLRRTKKSGVADELAAYIDQILAAFEEPALPSPASQQPAMLEPLTARELQILRLLATELTTDEIAEQLVVTVGTVRSHCKRIYGKLDAHSRFEAVSLAQELGLI